MNEPQTDGGDGETVPGVNRNGAPLLGDTRDLFRPKPSDIPREPGVYKWRDGDGRVIYVGKAKNLRNRLANYFQPLDRLHPRTQAMVLSARSLEWTVVGNELESLTLEYTWIKEFDPRFNVVFRDDKTYPYLAVSADEEYPRVWFTRTRGRKGTRYFGPYVKVWGVKDALDQLLRAYPVRTCAPGQFARAHAAGRPCLLASIGKCSAPCVGRISPQEHRRMVEQVVGILTGRLGPSYVARLRKEMQEASDGLEFEKAARIRDQIAALESAMQGNAVVFDPTVDADVFGLASDELEASVHVFFVRAGTIRGERNWSVERVEDISDAELMADLIGQVYSDMMDEARRQGAAGAGGARQSPPGAPEGPWDGLAAAPGGEADGAQADKDVAEPHPPASPGTAAWDVAEPHPGGAGAIRVTTRRDALAPTQSATALDGQARAQSTRRRHEREEMTGRDDLLAPMSPVPREVLLPVEPERREGLEAWLTGLRGSQVTIRVPQRGDKRDLMDKAGENARQALARGKASRLTDLSARSQALNEVADALGLAEAPLRIECYDVSNASGGGYQVASMVVFEDGMARKSEYRRFRIHGKDGRGEAGDTDAIYETLTRRFTHEETAQADEGGEGAGKAAAPADGRIAAGADDPAQAGAAGRDARRFAYRPSLIVVDGGAPQARAAARALADCGVTGVAVCGLAKRLEEVWLPDDDYPVILPRTSEGLYLLQRVRDESHRFAIAYHRQTRRKGALRSALDGIPGIGPAARKRLLSHFGSVRAMRAASVEQLTGVEGIGPAKAQAIFDALHAGEAHQDGE